MKNNMTTGEVTILSFLLGGEGRRKYNAPVGGKTRLVKELFILEKAYGVETGYDFIPYYFGPFAPEIYRDLASLRALELIKIEPGVSGDDISLTPRGVNLANEVSTELPKSIPDRIAKCKEKYNSISLNELIDYVYKHWPKYTDRSLTDPNNILKELKAEFDRVGITDEDIGEAIEDYRKEKKSRANECV